MDEFTPQNIVQYYAWKRRGITSRSEFESGIGSVNWKVARVTARSWWMDGVPKNMYLSSARKLAGYLRVKIDDLVKELPQKG